MTLFPWKVALRKRVLVTTKTDKTFRGVLFERRGQLLVLKDAELLRADGTSASLAGDVVIERSNLDFIQVVV